MAAWIPNGNTISTTGNVGIGTTTAQKPLDVAEVGGIRISQTAEASSDNEIYFADNGQIRSSDDTHRIIFNRAGNELEFREYGTITFSPGATAGQRTAQMQILGLGTVLMNTGLGVTGEAAFESGIVTRGISIASTVSSVGPPVSGVSLGVSGENLGLIDISSASQLAATKTPFTAASLLNLFTLAPHALGPVLTLTNAGGQPQAAVALDFNTFLPATSGVYNPSARIEAIDDGNWANDIVFLSNKPGAANGGLVESMRITSTGNVGIGVTAPTSRLQVAGDIAVTGDVILSGADCAEDFDSAGSEPPEPGTVVVIDEEGALRESRGAYDRRVAGVVSGAGQYRHGLVLDKRASQKPRVPVALVGKVYCKVDAEYAPIDVGDLLTTSPTEGHAMKAIDPSRAFGSVLGKALKRLEQGQGLIPILVTLQ